MDAAPIPAPAFAFAPDLARRVGLILAALAALAALVARRFLREPRLAALIIPLWTRLNRAARRFERLMLGLAAGTLPRPRTPRRGGPRQPRLLPAGRFWLIRALGPEAAACATQLQALLAEPTTTELLVRVPAAGRILRPLARLLAIGASAPRRRPARAVPAPPPAPPPLGEVAFRSAGFTWYAVPTPPANPV